MVKAFMKGFKAGVMVSGFMLGMSVTVDIIKGVADGIKQSELYKSMKAQKAQKGEKDETEEPSYAD